MPDGVLAGLFAAFVLLEKVVPHGVFAGRLSGALLVLAGLFVVVQG